MMILLPLFFHLLLAFDCSPKNNIVFHEIADGVSWAKYDLLFTPYNKEEEVWTQELSRSVTVRALKINFNKRKLSFIPRMENLACDPKKEKFIQNLIHSSQKNIIAAVNASFFVMPKGEILGIAKDEESIYSDKIDSQTISSSGILYQLQNKWQILKRDEFKKKNFTLNELNFAIQAYPRLLKDGQLEIGNGVLNHKRSRTSMGVNKNQDELIIVTIDARGENLKTGMTLFEYAHFLNLEKCGVKQFHALNLDGGGSTAFAIPQLNIYEQADSCRSLGNILTVQ